ncbi:radical SAM protein [Pseudodesulfovibrio piezophilus]|uniref:FeMo cofactor biosynthesis protein NifB n=1 Tax=Pseudodesulfovibrio piezophilus (strain DSM 21447 / JCM 15486 / C1TLV30) TaxID=1322246 RepID=M1WSE3_PSEP2|nr:radical SAM protein [Pseudodesulfovibrio piezophilus]CCH50139.1 FeMo cofactor biosynthesis protein nifB [Pseudodesulfovibrio piezophilus C1TLV30]
MSSKDTTKHPCFNKETAGSCGRVHLPVAPKCNIQCNYCNRKYDCVNESRPGVTSGVLKPFQAAEYMDKVLEKEPRITVAGIAGPGDPFANPTEVLETMRLLNQRHPELLFCLSSNGMGILPYLDDIAELGVSHVTITISAVDPVIGAQIYSWVKDGNVVYRGEKGAEILLDRQLKAIKGLKERGIVVKVNSIVIPGVNEEHLVEVAKVVSALGADIQNMIPIKPTQDTPFAEVPEPGKETVLPLRKEAGEYISQMTHCKRCRADAVGLLGNDQSVALCGTLKACASLKPIEVKMPKPYVAVATREGMLVNQHLGEAKSFQIWGEAETGGFHMIEERKAPNAGCGPKRWADLAAMLNDCRAVLAAAMGETPQMLLEEHGVKAHVVDGFIQDALAVVFSEGDIKTLKGRRGGIGGACCTGTGTSCG